MNDNPLSPPLLRGTILISFVKGDYFVFLFWINRIIPEQGVFSRPFQQPVFLLFYIVRGFAFSAAQICL